MYSKRLVSAKSMTNAGTFFFGPKVILVQSNDVRMSNGSQRSYFLTKPVEPFTVRELFGQDDFQRSEGIGVGVHAGNDYAESAATQQVEQFVFSERPRDGHWIRLEQGETDLSLRVRVTPQDRRELPEPALFTEELT